MTPVTGLPEPLGAAAASIPTEHDAELAGARIHWLSWGTPGRPLLMFVHGGAAHCWWWSWIAPLFAGRYHVVAPDLSGHGDSDRRPEYRFTTWAEEIRTLAALLAAQPPVLVAHSMGGFVCAVAATQVPAPAGLVVVDTPLGPPAGDAVLGAHNTFGKPRHYPTRELAVSRFRPLPDQPGNDPGLVRLVAERSVLPQNGGWGWKFDARAFAPHPPDRPTDLLSVLGRARCPVSIVAGGASEVVPDAERRALAAFAAGSPASRRVDYREIPGGRHHLMFDHPLELLAAVERAVRSVGHSGCGEDYATVGLPGA